MPGKEEGNLTKEVLPYLARINTSDYLEHLHEKPKQKEGQSTLQRSAGRILQIPGFDSFMGFIIVSNLIVMIIETDRTADEDESEAGKFHWTDGFGWAALMIFVCELLVRMLAAQCAFWQEKSNVFDFLIVTVDASFSLVGLFAGDAFPVSILRIFRLSKLARVSKVLRVFPELRILMAGLISSVSAIFWGTLLLFLCLLVWAIVAVLLIHPLNKDVNYGSSCDRCSRAYSTVFHATLTFWQQIVTGDSWGQATIPLIEEHPATVLFFVPVFLTVGMAVMNLILGVVVSVAQQAKEELEEEEKTEQALVKLEQESHLLDLCKDMDKDGSGELSFEEMKGGFAQPGPLRDSLLSLDISEEDFVIAWGIMDSDRSGAVSYKELVNYLCTMKSSDNKFMLAYIKYYISWIRATLMEQMKYQQEQTISMQHNLEQELQEVKKEEDEHHEMEEKLLNLSRQITTNFEEIGNCQPVEEAQASSKSSQKIQRVDASSTPDGHDNASDLHSNELCAPTATCETHKPIQRIPPSTAPGVIDKVHELSSQEGHGLNVASELWNHTSSSSGSFTRWLIPRWKHMTPSSLDEAPAWAHAISQDIGILRTELQALREADVGTLQCELGRILLHLDGRQTASEYHVI